MIWRRCFAVVVFVLATGGWVTGGSAMGADILFMVSDAAVPGNADPAIKAHLESLGHTVNLLTTGTANQAAQLAAANANDLVLISETIGSGTVLTGGVFNLQAYTKPVISFEAFMWDDAKWTGAVIDQDFGGTGRPSLAAAHPNLTDLSDTLTITNSGHPLAAGFANGPLVVYTQPYAFNFGALLGAGVTVIAVAEPADPVAVQFVYEPGSALVDGSITPGMRIGLYLGQTAAGNPADPGATQFAFMNANGLALLNAAVDYAAVPEPSSIVLSLIGALGLFGLIRRRAR